MKHLHTTALGFALALSITAGANAAPLDASAELGINPIFGSHQTNSEAIPFRAAPLPLVALDLRSGGNALHLEGLPPARIAQTGNTSLGLFTAMLRRDVGANSFVGVGQAVYTLDTRGRTNQFSGLLPERQLARITGARYEAGWHARTAHGETIFSASLSPVMRGGFTSLVSFSNGIGTFYDAERGAEIDLDARHYLRARANSLFLGVRYINYSARYDEANRPRNGALSDRNEGLAPTLGYRLQL